MALNQNNYSTITTIAYKELLNQRVCNLPVDPLKFKFHDLIIVSIQKYCDMTKSSFDDLTIRGFFKDGYVTENLRPGLKLVMYDDSRYTQRMRFTLMHELGHIRLGHARHGLLEEQEANFFAAQMLMPDAVINQIAKKGYNINVGCLMSAFYVSYNCAYKKIQYINEHPQTNSLDSNICDAFNKLLLCMPRRLNIQIDAV